MAAVIAIVASLETLLSLESIEQIDPAHRNAPSNRELKARGLSNMLAGSVGALPITAVVVAVPPPCMQADTAVYRA